MSLYERFLATEKVIYFANIQKICFMLFRIFIFLLPSMSQICCCTVPEIIENTLKHNKNNLCFERFIQGYKIEEKHTRSMTQLGDVTVFSTKYHNAPVSSLNYCNLTMLEKPSTHVLFTLDAIVSIPCISIHLIFNFGSCTGSDCEEFP
ncbi:Protein of unknown function [Gryllus bimaculatus]|nr:Protein of unknown function [Gryllus bimaculatus]